MSSSKTTVSFKWILPLIILTVLGLTQSYEFTMMGFTTFILAYLSKGIRRKKKVSLPLGSKTFKKYKESNVKL
ncbi:MAG: hypothetical protein AB4041_18450 [Microcystaceae cyanobacterium]